MKRIPFRFKWLLVFMVCLLMACSPVGPSFHRPHPPVPKTYTAPISQKQTIATATKMGKSQHFQAEKDIPAQWWSVFHSKSLNDLVLASVRCNPSVGAAKAALRASLENAYAQRGALLPFVGASFAPTVQQTAGVLQSNLANNAYNYSLYTGQLYVSYTLDIFGGIRRQIESLIAQADFQRMELEATYLTLSSNVVSAAIQEASLREQIVAVKQIIISQSEVVSIYQRRITLGDAALSDVATEEAQLAATQALLPPLEKQLALQRNLLNALAGRFPDDSRTPTFTLDSLTLPGELPLTLPSKLLEHRPDIRAAEAQMHVANALIGVSIANRLPNVSLGLTNGGSAALELSSLFGPKTPFWAIAGLVAQPIYAGGALMHKQRAAVATYQHAAAQYKYTVINAFQNVADTLKSIRIDALALRAAKKAERAALKSLNIARRQLDLGDNSMLLILVNVQLYQQARLNLVQAQANRLLDTVALFQALGGGWWNRGCCRVKAPILKTRSA